MPLKIKPRPQQQGNYGVDVSFMKHNTAHISPKHTFLVCPLAMTFDVRALIHILILACLLGVPVARARTLSAPEANPEAATGVSETGLVRSKRWMAAAANPLATRAGEQVLREGGSAVDAAIAMQLVLALVEPQSSGLGGGAFLLTYDAANGQVKSYDGRETAPAAADSNRFLNDGKAMPFNAAVNSGKSVGTPGLLRMLELAHRQHGRLPWPRLFKPAIELAEQGFPVSPRLHAQIAGNRELFAQQSARDYFYPAGEPASIGYVLKNPQLADVLRRVAGQGVDGFYQGEIAQAIVNAVHAHALAGDLSMDDLKNYRAKVRTPVCSNYKKLRLCGMGPPSSGGIAVLQMLGMLEQHHMDQMMPISLEAVHYFSEAGRLAFADRERYVADPDFIAVPVGNLLDPNYLRSRGAQIDSRLSMGVALPGDALNLLKKRGADNARDLPSTTHLVAVDRYGHGVSMTSTIESEFGSKIFVRGFLLNNQLTDFSLQPKDTSGQWVANRVEAGKRPRSSMAPIIVTKNNQLFMLVGSPGGSSIINFVAKTLIGVIDWNLNAYEAIKLPNMGSRNRDTEIERGTAIESLVPALREKGHRVNVFAMPSGVQAIVRDSSGLTGGADPRREGSVAGE
jgi:gamma-glutamyltranspeptidase/glutathione hydrolase